MKRILVLTLLLMAVPLWGQSGIDTPFFGWVAGSDGALRPLYGIPGSLLPGDPIATDVLSASSSQSWVMWKTADRLHVLNRDGRQKDWPAPLGPARFAFLDERPFAVLLEETGEVRVWNEATEEFSENPWPLSKVELEAWFGREEIGQGWSLVRSRVALSATKDGQTILVPQAAEPQLQLLSISQDLKETAVEGTVSFGSVAVGDSSIRRFRVRNLGPGAVTLRSFSLSGAGFTITDGFTVPRVVAQGFSEDFWVRFAPNAAGSARAVLTINTLSLEMTGNAPAWPTVQVENGQTWTTLTTATPLLFGPVVRDQVVTKRLRLINRTPGSLYVRSVTVEGEGFRMTGSWQSRVLAAEEASEIVVQFQPSRVGSVPGRIVVDDLILPLSGSGLEYPASKPAILLSTDQYGNGSQLRFQVRFSPAMPFAATGVASLQFQPATGLPDDPAMMFLPSGSRAMNFTVSKDGEWAAFDGVDSMALQFGTLAGAVTLRVVVAGQSDSREFTLSTAPTSIATARASRADTRLEVELSGYDNTRSLSTVAFQFFLKNGQAVTGGAITADIAKAMAAYFQDNPRSGGTFALRANFPVSGPVADLDRVEVVLTNSAGERRVQPLKF